FEAFHLKSCVHFKPYEGESSYIIFQKLLGCWSAVGDKKRGQNISIGAGCDQKAIVIHEILHALGFYHEQTRTDRDDYVKIQWDHVFPGQEHNFQKQGIKAVTDLNTPYDYESIMHYGPFSFGKNSSLATITTSMPEFNNIIGQRLDFSSTDLERLNQMYNCSKSIFRSSKICGLVQDPVGDAGWMHKKSSLMGQDHTYIQHCEGAGHFMYFNTSYGTKGDVAVLQSRIFYPKRKHQCLEFFYKMTGNLQDELIISAKKDDGTGNVRKRVKVKTFQGDNDHNWKIAHVNLNRRKPFRYLFHGLKGDPDNSSGGISIDDLTLSETKCPSAVWLIRNFSSLLKTAPEGYSMWSPQFYSPEGYGYGVVLYPKGLRSSALKNYIRISFHLVSGANDGILEWPVLHRQVTITVLDQHPNVMERMSSERSFITNETQLLPGTNYSRWRRPSIHSKFDPSCNCSRSPGWGWNKFISHAQLRRRNYLKNDDLIIFAEFEDLTHLRKTEKHFPQTWPLHEDRKKRLAPLEDWQPYRRQQCNPNPCQNDGICVNIKGNTSCRFPTISLQTRHLSPHNCMSPGLEQDAVNEQSEKIEIRHSIRNKTSFSSG
ncbi:hypothetical protein JRQ81_001962, partial [Phrynocephalus forsythii]